MAKGTNFGLNYFDWGSDMCLTFTFTHGALIQHKNNELQNIGMNQERHSLITKQQTIKATKQQKEVSHPTRSMRLIQ